MSGAISSSATASAPVPIAFSVVEALGTSMIFYIRDVDGDHYISYLVASAPGDDTSRTMYQAHDIKVRGTSVYTTGNLLSAIAYIRDGKQEIRVYYIGAGDPGLLREICQTNGGEWTDGALNEKLIFTAENTLLSASISEDRQSGVLKVFFQRANGKQASAVWTPLSTGKNWNDQTLSGPGPGTALFPSRF